MILRRGELGRVVDHAADTGDGQHDGGTHRREADRIMAADRVEVSGRGAVGVARALGEVDETGRHPSRRAAVDGADLMPDFGPCDRRLDARQQARLRLGQDRLRSGTELDEQHGLARNGVGRVRIHLHPADGGVQVEPEFPGQRPEIGDDIGPGQESVVARRHRGRPGMGLPPEEGEAILHGSPEPRGRHRTAALPASRTDSPSMCNSR